MPLESVQKDIKTIGVYAGKSLAVDAGNILTVPASRHVTEKIKLVMLYHVGQIQIVKPLLTQSCHLYLCPSVLDLIRLVRVIAISKFSSQISEIITK